jgi:nitrogen regulatory protein P-II 1
MKRVEAIIRPANLDKVIDALHQIGVTGLTVYEGQGMGDERPPAICYRGTSRPQKWIQRVKLEVLIDEDLSDAVIGAIYQYAYTGEVGDGRILITTIDEVIRIRTGQCEPPRVDASAR